MGDRAGVILVAAMAALCCGTSFFARPARAEEVRIGLAVPLAGRTSADGLAMERALTAAVADANRSGGLQGRQLTLVVEDDGCAAATGEGAARVLVAQMVSVVIGHPCSSAATAAVPIYAPVGVLLMAVGARHPLVTDALPEAPVLRFAGRDDRQGVAAADWLRGHAKDGRIVIVHDRTRYARGIADDTAATLKTTGIEPAAILPIIAGHRAYDEVLAKLDEVRAEAVLFAGYPEEAIIVADGIRARKAAVALLGSDSLATPQFANVAARGRTAIEVLFPVEPPSRENGARDTSVLGARAKGALEAWLAAAAKLGTTDGRAISKALRGSSVTTATLGAIRFDAHGDIEGAAFRAAPARGGQWMAGER